MTSDVRSRYLFTRRWFSVLILIALLLSALPSALLAAGDERTTAQEDATPIFLGEYVQQEAAKDDVFAYTVYLPEDGNYLISPDNSEAAQNFTAVILDEQGDSVYEGPLAMDAVALDAGEYTIEVTALDDGFLSFFFLGVIGGMSDSERSPGKLYAGSLYSEADVSETRYATISIPNTGHPQEVLLYFTPGEGDIFSLSVDGESISKYASSEDGDMIRFYTEGGEYRFSVAPQDRRSEFTVIVFLAGAPVQLELDGMIDATLAANADTQIFHIRLDDVYDDVAITLTPADDNEAELSMSVVDHYVDGSYYVYSETQEDGSLTASTGALLPGDYYVVVTSYDGIAAEYTLSAEGTPGAPMLSLELGEPATGTLEEGGVQYFRLDGVAAGTFLRVTLASNAEESDFDLHVGMSQPLDLWSSTATGPNEEVILVAPGDETYYVQISSYSGAGEYEVVAEEIAGVGMIDTNKTFVQSMDDDGYIVYAFAIDEPGQFLSVLIASQDAADLDLTVVHFSPKGERVHELSSITAGSSEIVSQAAADTGIYEVRVRAYGAGGDFALLVRVENPATLLSGSSQSSQGQDKPTVIWSDDFSDPDSGWAIDEGGAYGYADDAYTITAEPGVFHSLFQEDETYTDIALEADIVLLSGDPAAYAGLICRSTEDGYYYADISPAGDFTIGQIAGEDITLLTEWTVSEAIDTEDGAVNTLRLECIGDTISAYANGELLDSVAGEATAGGFGFEAGNSKDATEPATVAFDNLVVSQP